MEPEHTIVKVRWVDATDDTSVDITNIKHPLSQTYGSSRTAIGWLISEDETGILLSHDMCDDKDADISFIPKSMLTSMVRVRTKDGRE